MCTAPPQHVDRAAHAGAGARRKRGRLCQPDGTFGIRTDNFLKIGFGGGVFINRSVKEARGKRRGPTFYESGSLSGLRSEGRPHVAGEYIVARCVCVLYGVERISNLAGFVEEIVADRFRV